MKNIYYKLALLGLLVLPSYAFEEKDEEAVNSVNKIFAQDFMYQYSKSFFNSIEEYNKNRTDIKKLVSNMKSDDQKVFLEYLKKNKITSLPPIDFKNEVATLRIGGNKISFTVGTIFEKNVYVNGQKILLPAGKFKDNLDYLKLQLSNKNRKVTFLDLIINSAIAAEDKFENATFAALLIINNKFKENSWCAFCDDEYMEATKKNFEIVIEDIKRRARSCESGDDHQEVLASKIDDFVSYDSAAYDLKEKMNTYFKSYTDKTMTCEKIVKTIYKEQIDSQMEAPGFYTGSVGKEREQRNQQKYESFIVSKCQAYTDLRNCVVNNTYDGKEVYNRLSGKPKLQYYQKLKSSDYQPVDKYNMKR